jgi:hypothetical protein
VTSRGLRQNYYILVLVRAYYFGTGKQFFHRSYFPNKPIQRVIKYIYTYMTKELVIGESIGVWQLHSQEPITCEYYGTYSKKYGSLFMTSFPFCQETDGIVPHIIRRLEARREQKSFYILPHIYELSSQHKLLQFRDLLLGTKRNQKDTS